MKLHPCLYDKTKEHTDEAHDRLAISFDLEEIENLSKLLTKPSQSPSGIPAKGNFLSGELSLNEDLYDDGTDWQRVYHLERLRQCTELACWNRLDQWRKEAIKTCDEYPLALIHGPLGTSKTSMLVAYTVSRLTRRAKEAHGMLTVKCSYGCYRSIHSRLAGQDKLAYPERSTGPFPLLIYICVYSTCRKRRCG